MNSCIDESFSLGDFDINDQDIAIGGNIELPVGDFKKIPLSQLIDIGNTNYIVEEGNGDYYFDFSLPFKRYAQVDGNALTLEDKSFSERTSYFSFTVPAGLNISYSNKDNPFAFDEDFSFSFSSPEIPSMVKDIRKLYLNTGISLNISLDTEKLNGIKGTAVISRGSKLECPGWIELELGSNSPLSISGGILSFREDTPLPASGLEISMIVKSVDFSKMAQGKGFVNGKIVVDDSMRFCGSFYLNATVSTVEPNGAAAALRFSSRFNNLKIDAIEAKLDFRHELDQKIEYDFLTLPRFLRNDDVVFALKDPHARLEFDYNIPLSGTASFNLLTFAKGSDSPLGQYAVGN
ncbi:MAG: hypothetical protein HUJ93_09445, partial [Bacteroidales bacterium]|nr:hypothetical protein [Bacteroidales bacterium]